MSNALAAEIIELQAEVKELKEQLEVQDRINRRLEDEISELNYKYSNLFETVYNRL
ncbi:hypothetical protein D3C80_1800490 [compost metagenome]